MTLTLEKAIIIAASIHEGQVDKNGEPYILHPLRVMLSGRRKNEAQMIVDVLHDTIEDHPGKISLDSYRGIHGAGEDIVAALDAVSRRPGEEYAAYIERLGANELARSTKLDDLADNTQDWRLEGLDQPTRMRLLNKYRKAGDILAGYFEKAEQKSEPRKEELDGSSL